MNPQVTRVQISDVQRIDAFWAENFQVEFPLGTHVTDHRNRVASVAPNNVVDESRAMAEYVAVYLKDLSWFRGKSVFRKSALFWAIIIGSTFVVLTGLVVLHRKRAKKHVAGLFILVGSANSPALADYQAAEAPLDWSESGCVLQSGADCTEPGRQCFARKETHIVIPREALGQCSSPWATSLQSERAASLA